MPDATKRTRMRMPEKIAMMAHNIQAGKNVPNKKISGAMTLKRPGKFRRRFCLQNQHSSIAATSKIMGCDDISPPCVMEASAHHDRYGRSEIMYS